MNTRVIQHDAAENSVMQTIVIAVSTLLVAAGLITVPSSIANARDANALTDIDNIAYAQETAYAEASRYFTLDEEGQPADPELPEAVQYSLSGGTTSHFALVCTEPEAAYLLRVESSSDTVFYRASGSSLTSRYLTDLVVPQCIEDQISDYNASASEPFYMNPDGEPAQDNTAGGEPVADGEVDNTGTEFEPPVGEQPVTDPPAEQDGSANGNNGNSGNSNPNASENGQQNGNADANANGNNTTTGNGNNPTGGGAMGNGNNGNGNNGNGNNGNGNNGGGNGNSNGGGNGRGR